MAFSRFFSSGSRHEPFCSVLLEQKSESIGVKSVPAKAEVLIWPLGRGRASNRLRLDKQRIVRSPPKEKSCFSQARSDGLE
jgi:hypothetical protein